PLTARCPLIAWNDPNHHYELEAGLAPTTSGQASGGTIGLVFDLNLDSLEYRLASNLSDVQISPFAPYARDVIDISLLEGLLSMQFNLAGNFNSPSEVALSGKQQLRTFRLTDPEQDTLFSLSSFSIAVDSLIRPVPFMTSELSNWTALIWLSNCIPTEITLRDCYGIQQPLPP